MAEQETSGAHDEDVEVVDRRTGAGPQTGDEPVEEPSVEAPEEPEEPEEPVPTAEEAGIPPELLDLMMPPSVDVAARQAIGWFARLAWEHLGLVPGARTGKVEASIPEAGRAIDAADFLSKLVSPHLSPEHRRDLDTLIADLKVNFVQKQRG